MKKIIFILIIIIFILCGCNYNNKSIFKVEDIEYYKYGMIYSMHDKDSIIQLYDAAGNYLTEKTYPARALGMCSSSSIPYINYKNNWYITSDSVFDRNIKDFILYLNTKTLEISEIPTNIDGKFSYNPYVSKDKKYFYAFLYEMKDLGSLYITNIKSEKLQKKIKYNDLLKNININEKYTFWPMTLVEYKNSIISIGNFYNNGVSHCVLLETDKNFTEVLNFEEFLNVRYGQGCYLLNDTLYFTTWNSVTSETYIYSYDFIHDKRSQVLLNIESAFTQLYSKNGYIYLANSGFIENNEARIMIFNQELELLDNVKFDDICNQIIFTEDEILLGNYNNILIYDYEFNKKLTILINNPKGMMYSTIFYNE